MTDCHSATHAAIPPQARGGSGDDDFAGPRVVLVVGMAGTGKSTLVHRLQHYAYAHGRRGYYINLDPAVVEVPYKVNIDIRDTVSYREVMSTYSLGPNGAILTSLNLFATKMNQVIALLEQRRSSLDWVVVDTPGQIEVFTWSASGQLIAEALASTFTTVVLFVADTTRCVHPQTFMSTMLYASGIMLKQQLPLLVALNKVDVASADAVQKWMRDPDALDEAIASAQRGTRMGHLGSSQRDADAMPMLGDTLAETEHISPLVRSMSLFLHEFYENIACVAVSAASGAGMDALDSALATAGATVDQCGTVSTVASSAAPQVSASSTPDVQCSVRNEEHEAHEVQLHADR